jgi:hypothetical protein
VRFEQVGDHVLLFAQTDIACGDQLLLDYVRSHKHTYTHVHKYTHTHAHIHIYTHIHTYAQIHSHRCTDNPPRTYSGPTIRCHAFQSTQEVTTVDYNSFTQGHLKTEVASRQDG